MEQYEFQASLNGEGFVFPEALRNRKGNAKIIVIMDDEQKPRKKASFNAFRVDMSGYKFNREDCYER